MIWVLVWHEEGRVDGVEISWVEDPHAPALSVRPDLLPGQHPGLVVEPIGQRGRGGVEDADVVLGAAVRDTVAFEGS